MKNRFILLIALIQLSSCEVFRPASRGSDNLSGETSRTDHKQPVFIQTISTDNTGTSVKSPGTALYKPTDPKSKPHPVGTEDYNELKFKYSILTNTPVEDMSNMRLLIFMDQWYGVRYHYGGTGRDGIDCSAFSSLLMSDVYHVNQLPRMSADQYKTSKRISKKDLQEGDLVFFHTMGKGKRVTHVGVYLYNNRFIHASVSGVQINDLSEGYYQQHYVGAGRVVSQ